MGRGENGDRALQLGRYAVFDEIASGGMASVHIGRLLGPGGFSRTVAIKRLHPHLARDPHFTARFLDEAKLAARVRHPNVVSIIDVVEHEGEVALIMDFVLGEPLSKLLGILSARGQSVPAPLASGILVPVLQGLHAAHETRGDDGSLLGLVHRDVSPQNIVVGADGVCRVLDFGIAKAAALAGDATQEGILKGKIGYLAPEQLQGQPVDRRVDVFAAGVVLWEMLTGSRLFKSETPAEAMRKILGQSIAPPSRTSPEVPPTLDAVVLQALARDPELRFETAADMAVELERCARPASSAQVASWIESLAGDRVGTLRDRVSAVESSPIAVAATSEETIPDLRTPSGAAPAMPPDVKVSPPPPPRRRGPLPLILGFTGLVVVLGVIGYWQSKNTEAVATPAAAASGAPAGSASSASTSVSASSTPIPSEPCTEAELDGVSSLVSGPASRFTCALRGDNSVWCWGDNAAGQMADGTREPALGAKRVGKLEAAVEVAAGNRHACAILGDTKVACWGKDMLPKPTRVVGLDDVLHVRCGGRHGCVSRNDGTVLCWGENDRGQLGSTSSDAALTSSVEGLGKAKQISTGTDHACAVLEADGSVWCWGDNTYGQLGQGSTDKEPHPRPVRVPGLPPSSQVEAGDKTTFVRTRDGQVYGWGFGIKRPVRLSIEQVMSIAAGGKQNCALDVDGVVWCWGFNDFGQLGSATPDDSATPVRQGALTGVKAVAAGDVHVCAVVADGKVACWGSNEEGQLGNGTRDRERHPEPQRVRTMCEKSQ